MRIFILLALFAIPAFGEVSVKPPKLPSLLNSGVASNDLFLIYDTSAGTTKKILVSELDTRWSGGDGGGGAASWGTITGTLSNQTDLASALSGKQNTLSFGNLTSPTSGVSVSGGSSAVVGSGASISIQTSTDSLPGLLSAADHTTFNGKQTAGNYITALTGDVSASGPGSVSSTISATTVTGKLLTGYTSGAGVVAATDSILQGFQKINGNDALKAPLASPTFTGTVTLPLSTGIVHSGSGGATTSSTIVNADVSSSAAIDYSKLGSLSTGSILAGNAGVPTAVAMSGGATISNSGVVTLTNASVTGQALTGFSASAGTVASTDTIVQAFNKVQGWITALWVEEFNGQVEAPSNKTYVLIQKAKYARTINQISIQCASGSITATLKIGTTAVTSCGVSVTSSNSDTTCTAANTMAAGDQLNLVTTSNSTCVDMTFTVKATKS